MVTSKSRKIAFAVVAFMILSIITGSFSSTLNKAKAYVVGTPYTVTATSGLNIRAQATTNSASLGVIAYMNDVLVIQNLGNGWSKCAAYYNGRNVEGYMYNQWLEKGSPALCKASPCLNIRSGPSTGYSIKGTIPYNARMLVKTWNRDWCYVRYGNIYGYVSTRYIVGVANYGTCY